MMAGLQMDINAFTYFNITLIFFNITANIFYAWSFFLGRGKLKQPLNVLLGFLVLCIIVYCVTFIGVATSDYLQSNIGLILMLILLGLNTQSSMTCYIWLNFYYYVSIVPVKRVLVVWTKKNIKSVIYVGLIGETMLYAVHGALRMTVFASDFDGIHNQTADERSNELFHINEHFTIIIQVYIFLRVLIMMVSSFSTAHYLVKHIKNFASRLTSPKIQSQIRVTVAGVLQGLLYLIYYIFYLTYHIFVRFNPTYIISPRVFITATTLFVSATTVNIGISQTVIRQRAADVFGRLKALCGVNKATHDVSLHTSPAT